MNIRDIVAASHADALNKAYTYSSSYDFSSASTINISFADAVALYGGVRVPLLERIGKVKAREVTHRWRDAAVGAAAENAFVEGASIATIAAATTKTSPVAHTNTCQIVANVLQVSGSAMAEAENGVYGGELMNMLDWQLKAKMPQMLASIALSAWFNVEVTAATAAEASARQMSGLVGTVADDGFDDGLLSTTGRAYVYDKAGKALDEGVFNDWLELIAGNGGGDANLPTAVYTSLKGVRKISTFANATTLVQGDGLSNLVAGQRVSRYVAPWGEILDIVYEPQNTHDGTNSYNNWMCAINEENAAIASLRGDASDAGIQIIPLPVQGDLQSALMVWEGTVQYSVSKGAGVLKDFTISFA